MTEHDKNAFAPMGRRNFLSAGFAAAAAVAVAELPMAARAASTNAGFPSAPAAKTAARATKPIVIRDLAIGEGRTKTIVPITAGTADAVRASAQKLGQIAEIDIVEFRVDYLDIAQDAGKVAALSKDVAAAINGKAMILTFRTKLEGGNSPLEGKAYADYYATIVKEGRADFIDVELNRGEALAASIVKTAHAGNVKVVMSNHDFHNTVAAAELVRRLKLMDELGADILKLAAMPHDAGDVITLLSATWEMKSRHTDKPMITMAMGPVGLVSRMTGEVFGSAATFGMVGTASAPGQIDVHTLRLTLDSIHSAFA